MWLGEEKIKQWKKVTKFLKSFGLSVENFGKDSNSTPVRIEPKYCYIYQLVNLGRDRLIIDRARFLGRDLEGRYRFELLKEHIIYSLPEKEKWILKYCS